MKDPGYRRSQGLVGAMAAVAFCLLEVMTGGRAWAADPVNAVAVLPLEIEGNVPAGRPALESAVSRGLAVLSGPTIGATESAAKLGASGAKVPCATEACWTAAGKAIDARYLVAGKIERKGPLFEVRFRLMDAPSGRLLATETNKCEVADCSVAELCRTTVRELVRQTLGEPAATTAPALTPPPPGEPPPRPAAEPAAPILEPSPAGETAALHQEQPAPVPRAARIPAVVPIVAIVAGAAALGAGAYYLKREGDCTDSEEPCQTFHDTIWGGVGWTAGGVALVGTGVVMAVLRARARDGGSGSEGGTTLSFGPSSAFISGRF
jgi:hypothetical protein